MLQDKVDDAKAGVKSTALLFGERTKPVLGMFAGGQISLLALTGASYGCCPARGLFRCVAHYRLHIKERPIFSR